MTASSLRPQLRSALLRRLHAANPSQSRKHQKGFTLVELLIVVVILGILSAVGVPAYFKQLDKARANSANAAAMGGAKACAAALAGDQTLSTFGEGVSGTCGYSQAITATVGTKTATASIDAGGAVSMTTRATF